MYTRGNERGQRERAHVVREHRGEQAEIVVLLDQVEVALRDVRAAVGHDRQSLPLRRRWEPIQILEARAYAFLQHSAQNITLLTRSYPFHLYIFTYIF
jgi:hypothetical protein